MRRSQLVVLGALPAIVLLIAAGCGGCGNVDQEGTIPTANGPTAVEPAETEIVMVEGLADLAGTIAIDGSSTVYPVTEAVAEEFQNATGQKVKVTVGISGTGGGFKKFA